MLSAHLELSQCGKLPGELKLTLALARSPVVGSRRTIAAFLRSLSNIASPRNYARKLRLPSVRVVGSSRSQQAPKVGPAAYDKRALGTSEKETRAVSHALGRRSR